MRFMRGHLDRTATRDDGPLRFVAATEGVKADGLNLKMDRARLDRFRSNPVVMYGHMYFGRDSLPIGHATNVEIDGDRLLADIAFDSEEVDEFAARVEKKYRSGSLNAVSIGFDFGEIDRTGVPDWWELLEISAVPIPLDADALLEDGRDQVLVLARAMASMRDGELDLDELTRALTGTSGDATDALEVAGRAGAAAAEQLVAALREQGVIPPAPEQPPATPARDRRERRLRIINS